MDDGVNNVASVGDIFRYMNENYDRAIFVHTIASRLTHQPAKNEPAAAENYIRFDGEGILIRLVWNNQNAMCVCVWVSFKNWVSQKRRSENNEPGQSVYV